MKILCSLTHTTRRSHGPASDPAWQLAGKLLDRFEKSGSLQQENLAAYLYHGLPKSALELPGDLPQAQLNDWGWRAPRWEEKAARCLRRGFSNQEVFGHLEHLGDQLKTYAAGLDEDTQLHLQGSFVKGRLGVGSDLDVSLELPPGQALDRARQSFCRGQAEDGLVVLPLDANNSNRNRLLRHLAGPCLTVSSLQVARGELDLSALYENRLTHRGLKKIEGEWVKADFPSRRFEILPALEARLEKDLKGERSEAQKLEALDQVSFASSVLGALLPPGPLGIPVKLVLNQIVAQGEL